MMDITGDLTIGSPLSNSFAGLSLNLPLEINAPVADLRWTSPPGVETSFFESLSAQASTSQKAVTYHRVDTEVTLVQAFACSAVDYTLDTGEIPPLAFSSLMFFFYHTTLDATARL
jgi:hypothetical protein